MFKSKKRIYTRSVIKLFKVISSREVEQCNIPLKEIIELYKNSVQDDFQDIEINYGAKNWKKTQSLYHFMDKNKSYPIVYLNCYGKNSENNNLVYSNNLLNQTIREEFGLIDFIFALKDILIDEKYVMDFVNRMYPLFAFDYGYAFYLEKNQDIVTEQNIKKSLFSTSVSVTNTMTEERRKIQNVINGYLPKFRQFNILNEKQIIQSNITNAKIINDKLFLYSPPFPPRNR